MADRLQYLPVRVQGGVDVDFEGWGPLAPAYTVTSQAGA
jgi:hypothetical protein